MNTAVDTIRSLTDPTAPSASRASSHCADAECLPNRTRDTERESQQSSHFQAQTARFLRDFESYFADQLISRYGVVSRISGSAAALQGKRLRPQLVFLAATACGHVTEATTRLAAVVEMVHGATLVHDDVLDGASMRRHAPAAHIQWGTNPSILLGDILFSKAYLLAAGESSPFPARRVGEAGLALCEGELRQQATVGRWDLPLEEYLDILRQKTGELCAAAAALGAWSAGASDEIVDAMDRFGRKLGVAFQVFDDWLDVWGSAAVGKPLGNDLANRKPTLPTITLMQSKSASQRSDLCQRLNRGSLTDDLLVELHEVGASERTLEHANRLAAEAESALQILPDSDSKRMLAELARQSVKRSR
ncbi:MAG: polyprenyl synthetase family protein [Pirellulales bacterium]